MKEEADWGVAVWFADAHAISDTRVEIPDDRLRVAVEGVFSAPSHGVITTGDLASLQTFSSSSVRMERLDGLGHAANLRHLVLRHNRIEDVSALSGMTELAGLDLEGNDMSDIAALVENAGLARLSSVFRMNDGKIDRPVYDRVKSLAAFCFVCRITYRELTA